MLFNFVCKLVTRYPCINILFFISGYAPMISNRAAVRDCQPIENEYFRLARPASSTTESGKQGIV